MTPRITVWSAGKIRTQDAKAATVQAIVVHEGKIAFLGTRAAALAYAGSGAAVEDFPEAVIVPGLVDAHAHLLSLGRSLSIARLNGARTSQEAVELLEKAGPGSFQGEWLLGRGWDQNDWSSKEFPDRGLLDAKFPLHPVYLSRVDGHAAWVNAKALQAANITAHTEDPAGGRILRDAAGEPTGVLIDNAMDLVSSLIPRASDEQLRSRLTAAIERCASVGLTGIHDAGMEWAAFMQLQEWDARAELKIRIYAMADGQGADAPAYLKAGVFEGKKLRMRAVKLVADGALGSRGAALHAPYADEPAQSGLLLLTREELQQKARAFADKGFQVAIHAIGDKTNTLVIDVLSELEKNKPGGRHRVEHAQILRKEDVPRFAASNLIASFQPTHATSDMPWAAARVGEERLKFAYAWRALLDTGAHVAFGSDFPVEDPEPLAGLYSARTRQDPLGKPEGGWHPEQRVSAEEALAAFTSGSAYAEFAEERRGALSLGMDADFVVLSVDPISATPAELLKGKVKATVVGGAEVFRAP